MKKQITIPQTALLVLIIGLLISLILNGLQYGQSTSPVLALQGAYSTDANTSNSRYLAFDPYGYFCLYSQEEGILEEGNYTQYAENLYELDSISGHHGSILLTDRGVYYSSENGILEFYSRFNDIPVFVGDWAEDWDNWPEGPYEINVD